MADPAPATYKVVMEGSTMKHVKLSQEAGFQSYTPPPEGHILTPEDMEGHAPLGKRRASVTSQERRKSLHAKRASMKQLTTPP